jgi:hypothetical protein
VCRSSRHLQITLPTESEGLVFDRIWRASGFLRCSAHPEVDAGRHLSLHLGADSRKSGSAATSMAPPSRGENSGPSDESAAGHRHERRYTAKARAVERKRAKAAGL